MTASLNHLTRMGLLALALVACGDKDPAGDTDASASDSGDDGGGGEGGDDSGDDDGDDGGDDTWTPATCASGDEGRAEQIPAYVLESTVTWTMDFDEEAEDLGWIDCTYTRKFTGERKEGWGYLCPDCTLIFRGDSSFTEGQTDCYEPVLGTTDETRVEVWGLDGENMYRSSRDSYPLGAVTTYTDGDGEIALTWGSEYELTEGGMMTLIANGTMEVVDDGSEMDETFPPRAEPYTCGWECNDPGDLELDYACDNLGDLLPNARFEDACGELVELWDFYGAYLVIDTTQPDCGPCRTMASEEEAFVEELRAEGIPVRVITLVGRGLAAPYSKPDSSVVEEWISTYSLTEPVLHDEGYGYAIFPELIKNINGEEFGYPAWIVVDPQMRVINGNVGFSSWEVPAEMIRSDWESR